jgi:CXXX repeat modification system protein
MEGLNIKAPLTDEECKKIESLSLKRETLNELFITLSRNSLSDEQREMMYQRLMHDMQEVKKAMNDWWQVISQKYSMQSNDDLQWQVNFKTKEATLTSAVQV